MQDRHEVIHISMLPHPMGDVLPLPLLASRQHWFGPVSFNAPELHGKSKILLLFLSCLMSRLPAWTNLLTAVTLR